MSLSNTSSNSSSSSSSAARLTASGSLPLSQTTFAPPSLAIERLSPSRQHCCWRSRLHPQHTLRSNGSPARHPFPIPLPQNSHPDRVVPVVCSAVLPRCFRFCFVPVSLFSFRRRSLCGRFSFVPFPPIPLPIFAIENNLCGSLAP